MNKCEKCGYLHYRTDPCRKPKDVANAAPVETKFDKKSWMREYMRGYMRKRREEQREYRERNKNG